MLDKNLILDRLDQLSARVEILKDIVREANKPVSVELTNEQIAERICLCLDAPLTREQRQAQITVLLYNFYGVRNKPV